MMFISLRVDGVEASEALKLAGAVIAGDRLEYRFVSGVAVRVEKRPEGLMIAVFKEGA